MFNLGNLLQTTFITMGVASATPICDKQNNVLRADATTTNYSLTLTQNALTSNSYSNIRANDTGSNDFDIANEEEERYNITGNNTFLNIIGNQYKSKIYSPYDSNPTDVEITYYRSYDERENVNKDLYNSTQNLIILKVTPYQYNIGTEINISFEMNAYDTEIETDSAIILDDRYFERTIYSTVQENWDNYIDNNVTSLKVRSIIEEIEDVNNNYYYSKTQEIVRTGANVGLQRYTDTVTLNITPKVDNYFVINYVPLIKAHHLFENNNQTQDYVWVNVMATQSDGFNTTPQNITGTGVIPLSDYEVIDIPGLMWQILTMPFAFVSQAFNLTLFPGTPYQLNISNLFLSIIAVVIFVWLITFIIKMKG